jgi:hypothetical protein
MTNTIKASHLLEMDVGIFLIFLNLIYLKFLEARLSFHGISRLLSCIPAIKSYIPIVHLVP